MLTSLSRSANHLRVWAILFCLRVLVKFSSIGSFPAKADQHNPIRADRAERPVRRWGFGPLSRRGSKHGYISLSYSHAFRGFSGQDELEEIFSRGGILLWLRSLETSGLQFIARQGARGRQFHLDAQSQSVAKLFLHPASEFLRLKAGLIL